MNLLAIDASTTRASVALSKGEVLLGTVHEKSRQHAQYLLPMIEELLHTAGLRVYELDGVVFGCGPGSFTGLRIACSVAKAFAYAHDLPIYPVSGLMAIAHDAEEITPSVSILTLIDARMNQLYWAWFDELDGKRPEYVSSPECIELPGSSSLIIAGVEFESYLPLLSNSIKNRCIKQCVVYPEAKTMIRMVQLGQIKAVRAIDALPSYVRNQVTQGESRG